MPRQSRAKRVLFCVLMASAFLGPQALGQSVVLDWNPVTLDILGNPEQIQGYDLSYGTTPGGPYLDGFSAGNMVTAQIDDLVNGDHYYFVVRAVDQSGNVSDDSTETDYVVPIEDCLNGIDDDHDGLTDCQDVECPGQPEDCDGLDNDCDGQTDNGISGPDCAQQQGVCQGSTEACAGASGWQACTPAEYGPDYEASETSCDGLDNDCDGQTDQGLSAPACSLQLGVCNGALRACDGPAGWGTCDAADYGADYEADETRCDGMDNDCDDSTDENLTGPACPLQVGVCAGTSQICSGGAFQPCDAAAYGANYEADEAACDGLDNDCDDASDENLSGPPCSLQMGICAGSQRPCNGVAGWGTCDAAIYGATYEADENLCDSLDNDCDGLTDEACPCTQAETQTCSTDEGICTAGTQTCDQNGAWGACSGTMPGTEDCTGLDDDCDGSTDEDLTGPNCALQIGVCVGTTQSCGGAAGFLACDAAVYGQDYELSETRCDGLDNDCDDATDEDLDAPLCPLQLGVCEASQRPCQGAGGFGDCDAAIYGPGYEASESLCDGLDNDCDGLTDPACPCSQGQTQACSTDEGACQAGLQRCDANGEWDACDGVLPGTESCSGVDEDCDGQTDEDLTPPACPLQQGVCQGAQQSCQGAAGWECGVAEYGADYEEDEVACDGLDNDCDGEIDETNCGGSDGGPDAGIDAGTDGSIDEVLIQGGCNCGRSGQPASGAWMGLLLAGLLLRRTRNGHTRP